MAEKKDESKGTEAAAEAPAPKKSKKKLFIAVGGLVVLLAGAGVPLMMLGGGEKPAEEKVEEEHHESKHLATAAPDIFIVNLSETGAFLKVRMLLEYDEAYLKKVEEDLIKKGVMHAEGGGHEADPSKGKSTLTGYLALREPMIRDSVIRILSTKRANEVLSLDGKEKLKEEVIEGMNEALALDEGPIQQIYFQEFIIQ